MSNVGYATLQVIPSLKDLRKHLKSQADPILAKWAKEAGKDIGDTLARGASAGVGESLASAVRDGVQAGGTEGGRTLGDQVSKSTREGVKKGVSDGVKEGAKDGEGHLRASVGGALKAGFKRGFKAMFTGTQDQGSSMRRSLVLGIGGGLVDGIKSALSTAGDLVKTFASNAGEAMKDLGKTALTGIRGAIETAAGTAATGGLNLVLGALAAALLAIYGAIPLVVGGFLALAPVLLLVGGLAGALTTVLFGGVGAAGMFKLAFQGIGDAFSEINEKGKLSKKTLKSIHPEAAKLVQAVYKLKKPLKEIGKFVQGTLFAGMGKTITGLWKAWEKPLKPMLGSMGTSFNKFFKSILAPLGKSGFIENMKKAFGGFGAFIERLGKSMGPFIDALGSIAGASTVFLDALGNGLGGMMDSFSKWIKDAEKSGALKTFMQDAAQAFKDIWEIGGLVFGIIGAIVEILFPGSKKASKSVLGTVKDELQKVHTWLSDPKNQEKIKKFIDDAITKVQELFDKAQKEWIPKAEDFIKKVGDFVDRMDKWGQKFDTFSGKVGGALKRVGVGLLLLSGPIGWATLAFGSLGGGAKKGADNSESVFKGLPGRILGALTGLPGQMFTVGLNAIAGFIAGMGSQMGEAVSKAAAIAAAAVTSSKNTLNEHSPSRVMMEVGKFFTQGFVIGMSGGTAEVKATAAKIAGMAVKAFRQRGMSAKQADTATGRLLKALAPRQTWINNLAKSWDAVASRLDAARKRLADTIKARDDFAASVRDGIMSTGSLGNLDAGTPGVLLEKLRDSLTQAKDFSATLAKLRAKGLNADAYRQLVEGGVGSLGTAKALLEGGPAAIGQVNALQAELNRVATQLGTATSQSLYQAGVNAAAGLVKGLAAQQKAIESLMSKIAAAMVATIKKALGIRSPSRVFARLGGYVGEGMALGVDRSRGKVTKAVNALVAVPDKAYPWGQAPQAAQAPASQTEIHLHNSSATLEQLRALMERQAIIARVGRAR